MTPKEGIFVMFSRCWCEEYRLPDENYQELVKHVGAGDRRGSVLELIGG